MRKVYLPKTGFWSQRAVDELLKFPNARNDDFVDALAWIGMGLGKLANPGGVVQTTNIPKVGTLAWVKWSTKQQEKGISMNDTGGF